MSLAVKNDVFRLKIAVEDLLGMKMTDRSQCLKEVELCLCLLHAAYLAQQVKELSPVTVLHAKNQIMLSFKAE
jgi:hypothetical protein